MPRNHDARLKRLERETGSQDSEPVTVVIPEWGASYTLDAVQSAAVRRKYPGESLISIKMTWGDDDEGEDHDDV